MPVRIAAIAIFVFPLLTCVIGFRLYAHPKNPDAWFIWAVLQVIYAIPAILILKKVGLIRWLWSIWLGLGIVLSAGRVLSLWHSSYPHLAVGVVIAWTTQIIIAVLLFMPEANVFFRSSKEPNQPPGPTPLRGVGHL